MTPCVLLEVISRLPLSTILLASHASILIWRVELADWFVGGEDEILELTPARGFRVDEV
jgi:hypothetical protein